MVVIDSINGYLNAMPEERYLTLQLHELLAYLNQQGVITIMVLAQQGLVGTMKSTVDLTYLADTVVLSRFYEERGEVKKALSVIKKRSGRHERTIREMWVDNGRCLGRRTAAESPGSAHRSANIHRARKRRTAKTRWKALSRSLGRWRARRDAVARRTGHPRPRADEQRRATHGELPGEGRLWRCHLCGPGCAG